VTGVGQAAINASETAPRLSARTILAWLGPVFVTAVVFKLATNDGGRDPASLAVAQIAVVLGLIVVIVLGRARLGPIGASMLALSGLIALSSLWSVRPESTVRTLLLWTTYLGIAVITASTLPSRRAARVMIDALVCVAGWLVLVALFMYWGANNPGMRWYSTFYWPNPFAGFLLLTFPIELARYAGAGDRREAIAHGVLSVLLGGALVLTYSRGAWLSLLAALPFLLALLPRARRIPAVARLAGLAVFVAAAVMVATATVATGPGQGGSEVVSRAASVADAGDTSIQGRLAFWRAALQIFRDYPWLGTGAGTFAAVHASYQRDARFYARDAHNIYVQTLSELGLAGAVALGAVLAALVMTAARAMRAARASGDDVLVAECSTALVAFFAHSAVEQNWSFPADPAAAFLLVGVLASYAGRGETAARRHHWARWLAAVTLILLIATATMAYGAHHAWVAGQAAARQGDVEGAGRQYAKAARLNPIHPGYAALQAAIVMQSPVPDLIAARRYLARAMRLDRMNASHPLLLARYLMIGPPDPSRLDEAERLLRQSLQLDPRNRPEAYRLLARIHLERGGPDQAEQVYRDAAALYRGRGLARSITSLLLWPEVGTLLQEHAVLLMSSGRPVEAVEMLTELIQEDPTWAPAYIELARAYRRMGQPTEANRVLDEGLRRTDDEPLWVAWRMRQRGSGRAYER